MIAIGQITKSVGIKGEVKVQPLTDRMQRFQTLRTIWLGLDDRGGNEYVVDSVRLAKDHVVLRFSGVNTRSKADALKSRYILIPDDQAERGGKDTYFLHELMGMEVVTEEGVKVGTIEDIVRMPAGDTWLIKDGEKEILIPGVKEFIRSVDMGARKAVIHVIEGLLE
jgi:16S rRNA processing protein RimM